MYERCLHVVVCPWNASFILYNQTARILDILLTFEEATDVCATCLRIEGIKFKALVSYCVTWDIMLVTIARLNDIHKTQTL